MTIKVGIAGLDRGGNRNSWQLVAEPTIVVGHADDPGLRVAEDNVVNTGTSRQRPVRLVFYRPFARSTFISFFSRSGYVFLTM
jgi:hypothetical protein